MLSPISEAPRDGTVIGNEQPVGERIKWSDGLGWVGITPSGWEYILRRQPKQWLPLTEEQANG